MSPINDFLILIEASRIKNKSLSKHDVISILKAMRSISSDTKFIDSLMLFYKQISAENIINTSILTPREKEILHLIGLGRLNQNIALELKLSVSTVETHRKNIRKKLSLPRHRKLLEYAIIYNLKNDVLPIS